MKKEQQLRSLSCIFFFPKRFNNRLLKGEMIMCGNEAGVPSRFSLDMSTFSSSLSRIVPAGWSLSTKSGAIWEMGSVKRGSFGFTSRKSVIDNIIRHNRCQIIRNHASWMIKKRRFWTLLGIKHKIFCTTFLLIKKGTFLAFRLIYVPLSKWVKRSSSRILLRSCPSSKL